MKTIGLIGGMSWQSTQAYYRLLNEGINARLGGLHSAEILLASLDFAPLEALQHAGDWDGAAAALIRAARRLEAGGADFFLIGSNTMHRVADTVAGAVDIPLLHIADAAGDALARDGVRRAGLLGTAFTMELDFYRERLAGSYGIDVVVPELHDRQMLHDIIFQELCAGNFDADSREVLLAIIDRLGAHSIDGIILGCTELDLLIQPRDLEPALYDTTAIHAARAVESALEGA